MHAIMTSPVCQCYEVKITVIGSQTSPDSVNLYSMICHDISVCCLDNMTK